MAADMIWGGKGEVALAREGEGNSIYNYHPITLLGNPRLDNPFYYLIRGIPDLISQFQIGSPSNHYALPSRQRCSLHQGRPRPRPKVS